MELDLTALLESGFLDSIYRYALMDTVCTILIFWFFRLYNSLWAYAGYNEHIPNCRLLLLWPQRSSTWACTCWPCRRPKASLC